MLGGIGPARAIPGSLTAITLVLSSLQVMPTQGEQTGNEAFQLSLGPWMTLDAKSRSACRSDSKSDVAKGKIDSRSSKWRVKRKKLSNLDCFMLL